MRPKDGLILCANRLCCSPLNSVAAAIFVGIFLNSTNVQARSVKLDAQVGAFQVEAQSGNRGGSLAGPGVYRFGLGIEVLPSVEASVGYTLIMSNGIGGDLSFGLDTSFHYFPFTPVYDEQVKSEALKMKIHPLWRPFVGLGFHQREFQSVRSSFAGFGFQVGVERALTQNFDFRFSLRYISLNGPSGSTAAEITGTAGVVVLF